MKNNLFKTVFISGTILLLIGASSISSKSIYKLKIVGQFQNDDPSEMDPIEPDGIWWEYTVKAGTEYEAKFTVTKSKFTKESEGIYTYSMDGFQKLKDGNVLLGSLNEVHITFIRETEPYEINYDYEFRAAKVGGYLYLYCSIWCDEIDVALGDYEIKGYGWEKTANDIIDGTIKFGQYMSRFKTDSDDVDEGGGPSLVACDSAECIVTAWESYPAGSDWDDDNDMNKFWITSDWFCSTGDTHSGHYWLRCRTQ